MMKSKNKSETRTLLFLIFTLAWPTVMEQALQTVVVYVDTAMVGRLGAQASAAVGLTISMNWLINGPIFALGIGVLAFVARNNGAKRYDDLKVAAVQGIYLALFIGAFFSIVSIAISPVLPSWLGGAKEIQKDATAYFAIVGGAAIFRAIDIVLACTIRGTGNTKTPMKINALMNVCNIVLNYFLIYESRPMSIGSFHFIMPGADFGVAGAAMGTAVANMIGGLLMLRILFKSPLLSPKGISKRINGKVMYQCIRVGVPLALQRTAIFMGHVVFTSLVAGLGTITLAAHSIALTAEEMFYIPGFGMQDAGATLIGNAMGEGDEKKMDKLARLLIVVTVTIMTVTGLLLFLFPDVVMKIFTKDPEVIRQGVVVLRIVAISEPIYGALIIMEGIFNGVGNTKTTFIVGVSTMWGVRILFTFLCIVVFHLKLPAVWGCMVAENVIKAFVLGILFIRGAWKRGAVKYDD